MNENEIKLMAIFIAQLTRENIKFKVRGDDISKEIIITGW